MVGLLAAGIGTYEAHNHVEGLDSSTARAAVRRLEAIRAEKITLPQVIQAGQRDWVVHADSYFVRPQLLLGDDTLASRIRAQREMVPLLLRYGKQGVVDQYFARSNAAIRIASLPYQQGKGLWDASPAGNGVEQFLNPNYRRAALQMTNEEARENILLAQLAIRAYRGEHAGVAPASLQELTRGAHPYLSALPCDPFSPDGQAPLRYRGGKAYSVGEDGRGEDVW